MGYKSDIEIAQENVMLPIVDVAKSIGLSEENIENYGKYKAKVDYNILKDMENTPDAKLILVTAINPSPAGEGKTTVTVGLGDALSTALFCMSKEDGLNLVESLDGVEALWVAENGEQWTSSGWNHYVK